jgi:signal transduction histidine kinase
MTARTSGGTDDGEPPPGGTRRRVNPLQIRGKLALAFGLQLALVAGVAAAGVFGLRSVKGSFESAMAQGLLAERLAGEMKNELLEARRAEKDFLLRWQPEGVAAARSHVARSGKHVARIRELIGELERTTAGAPFVDPEQRITDDLVALKPYVNVYAEDFAGAVELIAARSAQDPALDEAFRALVGRLFQRSRGKSGVESFTEPLMQLRRRERDYLLRGEARAVDDVRRLGAELDGLIGASREVDPAGKSELDHLLAEYLGSFDRLAALEGRIARKTSDFQAAAIVVEPLVADIALAGEQDAATQVAAAQAASNRTVLLVTVSLGLAVLAGLGLAYLLGHQITAPLRDLARAAEAIRRGDLSAQVEVRSRDEIGALAATFNAMTGQLRDLVRSLEDRVRERERAQEQVHRLNEELEERVRERTAELEAANRELEAFSYSVSHDLRTPLRHIGGFVYLIDHRAAGLDEETRRHLGIISGAVKRMGSLIDALLTFSRIGRAELREAPVALDRLVEEARAELESETGDRRITWAVGPLPRVEGDRALLRQVIINLLANAVKFTRGRPEARIEVRAAPELEQPGEAAFLVRDNGVGFDMAYAEKLFGVFKRLHRPEEFEGTGIGLANVERIVRRHGGRVWAEAALDRGATFFVALPREPGARPAPGPAPPAS